MPVPFHAAYISYHVNHKFFPLIARKKLRLQLKAEKKIELKKWQREFHLNFVYFIWLKRIMYGRSDTDDDDDDDSNKHSEKLSTKTW